MRASGVRAEVELSHRLSFRSAPTSERAIGDRPRGEFCEALMRAGVPAGPVNSVSEAFAQPRAKHRQMAVRRDGYRGIGLPVRLQATAGAAGSSPRSFNADAVCLLQDLGYGAEEIRRSFFRSHRPVGQHCVRGPQCAAHGPPARSPIGRAGVPPVRGSPRQLGRHATGQAPPGASHVCCHSPSHSCPGRMLLSISRFGWREPRAVAR